MNTLPLKGQVLKLQRDIFVGVPDKFKKLGEHFGKYYKEERRKVEYTFSRLHGSSLFGRLRGHDVYSKDNCRGYIIPANTCVLLKNIYSSKAQYQGEYISNTDLVYQVMIPDPDTQEKTSRTALLGREYVTSDITDEEKVRFRKCQADWLIQEITDPLRYTAHLDLLYGEDK